MTAQYSASLKKDETGIPLVTVLTLPETTSMACCTKFNEHDEQRDYASAPPLCHQENEEVIPVREAVGERRGHFATQHDHS